MCVRRAQSERPQDSKQKNEEREGYWGTERKEKVVVVETSDRVWANAEDSMPPLKIKKKVGINADWARAPSQ